jgi:hypothetical protein
MRCEKQSPLARPYLDGTIMLDCILLKEDCINFAKDRSHFQFLHITKGVQNFINFCKILD